jgi:hypothetical protein
MAYEADRLVIDQPYPPIVIEHQVRVDFGIFFQGMTFEALSPPVCIGSSPQEIRRFREARSSVRIMAGQAADLAVKERELLSGADIVGLSGKEINGVMVVPVCMTPEAER